MSITSFLDLDAVLADVPKITIKLEGVEHALVQLSVDAWIKSTKEAQALAAKVESTVDDEVVAVVAMIMRTFPTMTEVMLRKLPLSALNRIVEFARQNNGDATAAKEVEAEVLGNEPAPALTPEPKVVPPVAPPTQAPTSEPAPVLTPEPEVVLPVAPPTQAPTSEPSISGSSSVA